KLPLLLSQTLQSIRIVGVPKLQLYRRQLVTERTERLSHQLFLPGIYSYLADRVDQTTPATLVIFVPAKPREAISKSTSTISRTRSLNVCCGFQPKTWRAFAESPTSESTSAGR